MKRPVLRLLVGLPFLISLASCADKNAYGVRPESEIKLPRDISFIARAKHTDPTGRHTISWGAFVSDGDRWRLETIGPRREYSAAICDGLRVATWPAAEGEEAINLHFADPRALLEQWYGLLPDAEYRGKENVGDFRCSRFDVANDLASWSLWIDDFTQTPRRVVSRQGILVEESTYADLPPEIIITDALFDTQNTTPRLLDPKKLR